MHYQKYELLVVCGNNMIIYLEEKRECKGEEVEKRTTPVVGITMLTTPEVGFRCVDRASLLKLNQPN